MVPLEEVHGLLAPLVPLGLHGLSEEVPLASGITLKAQIIMNSPADGGLADI